MVTRSETISQYLPSQNGDLCKHRGRPVSEEPNRDSILLFAPIGPKCRSLCSHFIPAILSRSLVHAFLLTFLESVLLNCQVDIS